VFLQHLSCIISERELTFNCGAMTNQDPIDKKSLSEHHFNVKIDSSGGKNEGYQNVNLVNCVSFNWLPGGKTCCWIPASNNSCGKVGFEFKAEIVYPTPIGIFSAGVVVDPTEYFNKDNTLTVRLDCEDQFYDFHSRDFSLDFESGYYEKINITKRRNDIFLELRRIGVTSADCPTPLYDSSAISNIHMSTDSSGGNRATIFSPYETIYLFFDVDQVEKGAEIGIMLLQQVTDPYDPAPRIPLDVFIPDGEDAQTFTYNGTPRFNIYWPDGYPCSEGGHFMVQIFIDRVKVGEQQFDIR